MLKVENHWSEPGFHSMLPRSWTLRFRKKISDFLGSQSGCQEPPQSASFQSCSLRLLRSSGGSQAVQLPSNDDVSLLPTLLPH